MKKIMIVLASSMVSLRAASDVQSSTTYSATAHNVNIADKEEVINTINSLGEQLRGAISKLRK